MQPPSPFLGPGVLSRPPPCTRPVLIAGAMPSKSFGLIGRYQVLQPLGHGGMGSIYLARDPKIGDRAVVIKLLRNGFDDREMRERFASSRR